MRACIYIFDFIDWENSRSWSYVSGYSIFHDIANELRNTELIILPYSYSYQQIEEVIINNTYEKKYDLSIIFLPHNNYNKKIIRYIESISERILFILVESLLYTKKELQELPHLKHRLFDTIKLLRFRYDVVTLCYESHRELKKYGVNSYFSHGFIPGLIFNNFEYNKKNGYTIAGKLYNDKRINAKKSIKNIISIINEDEVCIKDSPIHAQKFEEYFKQLIDCDLSKVNSIKRQLICKNIADIRKKIWIEYINNLSNLNYVVSLPSYFKGLPGRVIEGLIAKCKIIIVSNSLVNTKNKYNDMIIINEDFIENKIMELEFEGGDGLYIFDNFNCYLYTIKNLGRVNNLNWKYLLKCVTGVRLKIE